MVTIFFKISNYLTYKICIFSNLSFLYLQVNDHDMVTVNAHDVLVVLLPEMGGSESIYKNISSSDSEVEYNVIFQVPPNIRVNGIADIIIFGSMPQKTTQYEVYMKTLRMML